MIWQRFIHRFGYHHTSLTLPQRDGMIEPTLVCGWCGMHAKLPEHLYDHYFGKEH